MSGNGTRPLLMLISTTELIGVTERVVQERSASKLGWEINLSMPASNTLSSSQCMFRFGGN